MRAVADRRTALRQRRQQGEQVEKAAASRLGRSSQPWWRATWFQACLGSCLYWLALPPLNGWPLAWIAPLLWLRIVDQRELSGPWPRFGLWAAGFLFWVLTLHGLVLAHWANYLGLPLLAAYLAIWPTLFFALSRVAVHRFRIPLALAAPVVWTGLELARGYGPIGLSVALLGHTQLPVPSLIQVSDLAGSFTVSFAMVLVGSLLVTALRQQRRQALVSFSGALVCIACLLGYGNWRLSQPLPDEVVMRVGLIQGSIDTTFGVDEGRVDRILGQYIGESEKLCRQEPDLDLIVWPESMFPLYRIVVREEPPQLESGMTPEWVTYAQAEFADFSKRLVAQLNQLNEGKHRDAGLNLILGTTTWELGRQPSRRYNSALLIQADGTVGAEYAKMHPLMFGEYLPGGDLFPWLYELAPIPKGLSAGKTPVTFQQNSLRLAPSICFESTMPHLIQQQVAELTSRGEKPDVLINLTNDGWFWGSSILDLHASAAAFRAVEHRRPMLVAANTGFSLWVDGNGRIQAKGPRRAVGSLVAEVRRDRRWSVYSQVGQYPTGLCLLACLILGATGLWDLRQARRHRMDSSAG